MQSKIYKWENGRVVEVGNIKDAQTAPLNPSEVEKRYKKERDRAAAAKEKNR